MGAIAIRRTHNVSAVRALVLGNTSPTGQLITWYAQVGHFPGQGATIHGACLGGHNQCQGKQSSYYESLHNVFERVCLCYGYARLELVRLLLLHCCTCDIYT